MAWNWPWRARGVRAARRSTRSGFVALHAQGEARWTRRDYAALAREGFMRNPVVHRSVRLIAETAAARALAALRGRRRSVTEHPLLALLARPNQRQAGASFLEALYGHLLLVGQRLCRDWSRRRASARELHLLRPDRVTVVDRRATAGRRRSNTAAGGRQALVPLGRRAHAGGALHLTLFHPLDDHYGFAPLEAALMALDIAQCGGRAGTRRCSTIRRGRPARWSMRRRRAATSADEQFDRLKAELEDGYSGAARAGRPLLLEGGLDWKAMGLSPKDMDFIEAKNGAARDIALAFGVPPMLLGIPGDNTYANYQEANRAFYRLTVLPLVARTAEELSAWLAPVFGEGLRLWYDADQVDGLAGEREALWARVGAASSSATTRSARRWGMGRRRASVG